jgi:hypothetical protein
MLPVIVQHFLEMDPRQNVTVDDQDWVQRVFSSASGPRGTHGMIFFQIVQPDSEAFAVSEMVHDGFRKIVRGEVDVADPGPAELLNNQFQ